MNKSTGEQTFFEGNQPATIVGFILEILLGSFIDYDKILGQWNITVYQSLYINPMSMGFRNRSEYAFLLSKQVH